MEVAFKDEFLAKKVDGDPAVAEPLPISTIRTLRKKLAMLRAASDVRTLRNWRGFGFIPSGDDASCSFQFALEDRATVLCLFDRADRPSKVTILAISEESR